ncbi:MAG: lysophospholipid acyltransferase family protein [Opitutales bacterium]|jgi:1-acyl-sn-glycerol-3-phosphate acyltransferase
MSAPDIVPDARAAAPEFPWFYALVWHASQAFFRVAGRAEAAGLENVPRTGPFLLASNHASFLDPPLLGCFLPRPICFTPRKTLWNFAPLGSALDHLKCIPVDRDDGIAIGVFKRVIAAINRGDGVLVFPEGTRTSDGRLQTPRRGVGMLAAKLQVPIVPARVFGTYETFNRHQSFPHPFYRLGVTYGPALPPSAYDPGPRDPERYDTIARRVLDAIAALPPPWS